MVSFMRNLTNTFDQPQEGFWFRDWQMLNLEILGVENMDYNYFALFVMFELTLHMLMISYPSTIF